METSTIVVMSVVYGILLVGFGISLYKLLKNQ